ncbi:MAG: hypothetical protein V3V08_17260 [Nannocystaceae bacterium]
MGIGLVLAPASSSAAIAHATGPSLDVHSSVVVPADLHADGRQGGPTNDPARPVAVAKSVEAPTTVAEPATRHAATPVAAATNTNTNTNTDADADADAWGEDDDWGDDDDWSDDSGPVDRTPKLSGVLAASARATQFAADDLPDGTPIADEVTFQIEHTHLKFSGDLTHKLAWEIMPCLTHMNSFSVMTAHFVYTVAPALQVTAGRFLLPFGHFNLRSLPGSFTPISRPLLYVSHEDRPVRFELGTPPSLMFTPRDDVGVQVSGNAWFAPNDVMQLSYMLYATNGLREASNQMSRHWDDNNNSKQLGGRVELGYNGAVLTTTVGGSLLANDYEDDPDTGRGLNQIAWNVDSSVSLRSRRGQRLTVRADYTRMHREVIPNDALRRGDERLEGGYAAIEAEFEPGTGLYYQYDASRQITPRARINETFYDLETIANRHVTGVFVTLAEFMQIKAEYGLSRHGWGIPDAHRVGLQTIVSF